MSKQQIITIEDKHYVINSFKGIKGVKYLQQVSKHLIPLWTTVLSSGGLHDEQIFEKLTDLLINDEKGEIAELLINLVSEVEVNGIKIDPDKEFECNYDLLFRLVVEVIKLNYWGTFQKLVTNLMQPTKENSVI